jgi:serine/threonine protein kinase
MGEVYLARSRGGRPVAVKTLLTDGLLGAPERKRFAREIALARRVNGAYTADVIDADAGADVPWMATEYVGAPSLSELVKDCGVLAPPAVFWVGAGITEALGALHAEGIVHRDLKPANILLPGAGPRLIDFGISHASDLTRTEVTLGTIAFTSPEQARGEPSSSASDVYALGATLFHLAVGRPPYPPSEPLQLLVRVGEGRLELDEVPGELDELVRACLRYEPAERIRPAELLDALAQHIDTRPEAVGGAEWLPEPWRQRIARYENRSPTFDGQATWREPVAPAEPTSGPTRTAVLRQEPHVAPRLAPPPTPTSPDASPQRRAPVKRTIVRTVASTTGARAAGDAVPERVHPLAVHPSPPLGVWAVRARLATTAAVVVLVSFLAYALLSGGPADSPAPAPVAAGPAPVLSTPPASLLPKMELTKLPVTQFVKAHKGECVNLAGEDDPNVAIWAPWTKEELHAVPCASRTAYMQVTDVLWGEDECHTGAGLGEYKTQYREVDAAAVSVCLKRQYRVGQCFPGLMAKKKADTRVQILAVQPCRTSELSQLNNTMFKISGVYPGTSSRRCGERDYYWILEELDRVLCVTKL